MGEGGLIYGKVRADVLLKNKSSASSVSMLPALIFTQFITIVPLKFFTADAVERTYRLKAVCFSIG
jgi:hypothetical protein